MNGGHEPLLEAEFVPDHLHQRRQAIGRAGSVGNHVVMRGFIFVLVHTQHNGDVFFFGGSRDDDLLDGSLQMAGCFLFVGKNTRGFHHQVDLVIGPRDVRRIAKTQNRNFLSVHDEIRVVVTDLPGKLPQNRIILQKMGVRLDGHG